MLDDCCFVTLSCVAGYKGLNNDPNKEWVMEAKDGEQFEEGQDPFLAQSRAKKEAIQVLLQLQLNYCPPSHACCIAHYFMRRAAETRQA